jgi:hypothetical protein
MPDLDTLLGWRGRTIVDRNGEQLGKLGDLYLDERTDRPAYAGVRTGLFGRRESIIPLAGVVERDGDLVAPLDAERVRDAPSLDPDEALTPEEQERLGRHYDSEDAGEDEDDADVDRTTRTEAEMVRSEEELQTGTTEMRPAERVRLRKVLVTENVERTVPVRREEIRLETEPPPEGRIERVEDVERD